jgi:plastocyanin
MAITKLQPFNLDTTDNYTFANVTASNINGANLVSANYVTGTLTTAAQPNITSVGTLTSLAITGNITSGNANLGNLATANFFTGNGSQLSALTFGNITTFTTAGLSTDKLYLQGTTRLNVTASGSSGYIFDQYGATVNPALYVTSGQTLAFNLNVSGHPFLIQTSGGANYSTGLEHVDSTGTVLSTTSAQGQISGTLYWKVPYGITGNYKYQCSAHGGMNGNIVVTDANIANISVGLATYATTANAVAGANVSGEVSFAATANSVAGANVSGAVAYASTANSVAGANVSGAVAYASTANSVAGANVSGEVSFAATANSVAGANVSGQVANALVSSTVYTNAQPNITSVGTLSNLAVTGNISAGNVLTDNLLYANGVAWSFGGGGTPGGSNTFIQFNDGSTFGGNAGLTFNKTTTTLTANNFVATTTANLGNVGNVRITGGSSSQYLQTDGTGNLAWVSISSSSTLGNGNSAVSIPAANGNINITAVGNTTAIVTGTGVNVSGTLNVTGQSNLGAVGNVVITGGTNGYVLQTDGAGSLSWVAQSGGGGGGSSISNGNSNVNIPSANGNVNISAVGNANILVVTGTGINVAGTLTSTGNVIANNISAGAGAGGSITGANLISANYFTGLFSNGNSNINIPSANGNVTVSAGGNANILVVTSTGTSVTGNANITGNIIAGNANITGNIIGANYISANYFYGTIVSSASSQPNITSVGALTGLTVSNAATTVNFTTGTVNFTTNTVNFANVSNVNLGSVSNIHIANGTANHFLKTDGTGNLTWSQAIPTITDDTGSGTTYYPVYATSSSGGFLTAGISSTKLQFVPGTGTLTVTDLNTLSDATLKENQESITDPMAVLSQLFGMGFNWADSKKKSYGLMAQMVEKILPELVNTNQQGQKAVNYIPIIAFLIEAVKKQQEDIDALKKR